MSGGEDDLASRAQGRIGTVLKGKYRIETVLGAGGMAVVYKATHRNQAEFAVKMLHPELSLREDVRTRFLREGYAANSVKHPGAVAVVDDDVAEDGAAFLVMELLSGAAVETLWEQGRGRLPLRAVVAIADQLLDVLAAAHAKGIVHRDIKPPNLFITKDGTVKVLDFGIARVRDAAGSGAGHHTGTGMLLGTPAFMAPEQAYAKASEIDGQTDVWAVGATLFTLLTGQPVHEGENAAQLMIHAATMRARPLASLVSDVPPVIAEVIDQALMFEKTARWPTAAAMQEALAKASVAAFGEKPGRSLLATVVNGEDAGIASTQIAPVNVVTPARTGGAVPVLIPRSSTSHVVGGTTSQPISSEPLPSLPLHGTHSTGRSKAGPIAVLAVLLIGGGALAMRAVNGTKLDPPAAAKGDLTRPIPSASVVDASLPATIPVAATTGAPAVTARMAPIPAPEAARATGHGKPVAASIRVVPNHGDPTVQKPAAHSAPSATAAPDCTLPTWTDEAGHVHFKQGCD